MKKLLLISALIAMVPSTGFAREIASNDKTHKGNDNKIKQQSAENVIKGKQTDKNQVMEKVQQYFNSLKTFESTFVQVDRHGNVQSGYLWIKRPDCVKMQYPKQVVIVKDNRVISYDKELKEKSETSVYSSPLSFFLNKKVNLNDNLNIIYASETEDAMFIKLCKKDEDVEGSVLFVFSKNPTELRKWIVFADKNDESAGVEISLFNWKTGGKIPDSTFNKY